MKLDGVFFMELGFWLPVLPVSGSIPPPLGASRSRPFPACPRVRHKSHGRAGGFVPQWAAVWVFEWLTHFGTVRWLFVLQFSYS